MIGYSPEETKSKFEAQARRGINMMMLYGGSVVPFKVQREVLDAAHAVGMRLIWQVTDQLDAVTGANGASAPNSTSDWNNLRSVVENIRNHSALLGYYVCDDCCRSYEFQDKQMPAAYRDLKWLDPYHITYGELRAVILIAIVDSRDSLFIVSASFTTNPLQHPLQLILFSILYN